MSTPNSDKNAQVTTLGQSQDSAPPKATPAELIDTLNVLFGKQTHNRAVHAKGIVLEGKFFPDPSAASLSKAPHFQTAATALTVRFSDFAGIPTIPDTDAAASPHGLGLKFHLPKGAQTDIVAHSFNGFPSPTADEFRQLAIALGSSGPGVAAPTPADTYLAAHPIAKAFLSSQQPPPTSYATLSYFGVNSFKFTNEQGKAVFGRYRIEPQAGNQFLSAEQVAQAGPDYLADELRRRVTGAIVRFNLRVQLAEPGDKIDDPSIAWPDSRRTIEAGVIEITKAVADNDAAQRALLFLPADLPAGIEAADPMIQVRSDSYRISFNRRRQ
jgi:catalase